MGEGKCYWKFNNSLLDDNDFIEDTKNTINQFIAESKTFEGPRINWEFLKYKFRKKAKKFANAKSQHRN